MSDKPPVQNNPFLLVPAFRQRVELVLDTLVHLGHEPRLFETLRSEERAEWLAEHGDGHTTGLRSMHLFGIAADIICGKHQWSCPGDCDLFYALGRVAKACGLEWGGDWSKPDKPHVQAIPVSLQDKLREAPIPACYATAHLMGQL